MLYTSCKRGLGSGPGFQVQAASSGLSDTERYDLEQLPPFKCPRRLPTSPSENDIKIFCPANLQLTYLSDGRAAVTRTVYAGADYSGRRGNFLAHSLVFDCKSDLWPIDLALWNQWRETVTDEPPQLNAISISGLNISAKLFDFPSLQGFIREENFRSDKLAAMLDALFISRAANRPILIRDAIRSLPLWLACLTKVLPRNSTPPFTFASFVNSQLDGFDIQCTSPDSDVKISSDELQNRAYVFDFVERQFSDVTVDVFRSGEYLAFKLRDNPDWFESFHNFTRSVSLEVTSKSMYCLITCFRMISDDDFPLHEHVGRLAEILSFAGTVFGETNDGRSNVVRMIERSLEIAKKNTQCRQCVSLGLQELCRKTRAPEVIEHSCRGCVALIHDALGLGEAEWETLFDQLRSFSVTVPGSWGNIQAALLNKDVLTKLISKRHAASEHVERIIRFVAKAACGNEPSAAKRNETIRDASIALINATSARSIIPPLLSAIADMDGAQAFCESCVDLATVLKGVECHDAIADGLVKALDSSLATDKTQIRQKFVKGAWFDLLLAELRIRGATSDASTSGFLELLTFLSRSLPRSSRSEILSIVEKTYNSFNERSRTELSSWLVQHPDLLMELNSTTVTKVIQDVASAMSLDSSDRKGADQSAAIQNLCKKTRQPVPLQLPLRSFVESVRRGKFRRLNDVWTSWSPLSQKASLPLGKQVVDQTLFSLLAMTTTPQEHRSVVTWACAVAGEDATSAAYDQVLESKSFANISPNAAGAFAVVAIAGAIPEKYSDQLALHANQRIDAWLNALPKKTHSLLPQYVRAHGKGLDNAVLTKWSERMLKSTRNRTTWFGRILRLVGGFGD